MNIQDVIDKARRKPLEAKKLEELLLKLRKNATGTLTFGKLVNVLDALGWEIETTLGWLMMHFPQNSQGKEMPLSMSARAFSGDGLEEKRTEMLAKAVRSLPDSPAEPGEHVVMDVSPVKNFTADPLTAHFTYKEWQGVEGVVVRSSKGAEFVVLPGKYDVAGGRVTKIDHLVHDIWRGMKQSGGDEAIAATLAMEVHVPADARSRENTGTCPACWGNFKLGNGALVVHGYERPGWGHIKGSCFGVGYPPVETSPLGAVEYRDQVLKPSLAGERESMARAKAGEIEKFEIGRDRFVKKGEPGFDLRLSQFIDRTKRLIDQLDHEVSLYDKLVAVWRQRPMPRDGEPMRGMGHFLK